jgi:tetratricopeptide (TPR) repeat protein
MHQSRAVNKIPFQSPSGECRTGLKQLRAFVLPPLKMLALFYFLLASIGIHAQDAKSDEILKAAITEQQNQQYDAAIRDYKKVLKIHPDMVEAKVNLGAALAHVEQYDEAIEMYQSALPFLSYKDPVILNLGLAYYKKRDYPNAHEQFEVIHKTQPNDARIALLLADTNLHLNKVKDAVAILEPLAAANSQDMDFEYVYGSALIAAGRRQEGVPHLEAVAEATHSADAYVIAGESLLALDEFEHAKTDLEAALRLNPKLHGIHTLVGIARDKTGDTANAEAAFREALKINPDDFQANLYLGAILYQRRELLEAKPYLDRALKLNPSDNMARYENAMFKNASGEYDSALAELEQLEKSAPDWLEPHIALATLYYKVHRPEDGARERQTVDRLTAEQQARGTRSK